MRQVNRAASRRRWRFSGARLLAACLGLLAAGISPAALAAPYQGEGFAPVDADAKKALAAHRTALLRARTDALAAALDELPTQPSKSLRERLLGQAAAWTAAYRVLQQTDDGATVRVVVEVEVNVPRLAKAIAMAEAGAQPAAATPAAKRPVLAGIDGDEGCAPTLKTPLTDALLASGTLEKAGEGAPVRIELRCRLLGRVPYAGLHGAEGVAIIRELGEQSAGSKTRVLAAHDASGFARGDEAALAALTRELAAGVTRALATHHGDQLTVVLERGGTSSQVRRLERLLRQSVVGVQAAGLSGVAADGAAQISVSAPGVTVEQLATRVDGLQLPSGLVHVVAMEPPGVLRIHLQP